LVKRTVSGGVVLDLPVCNATVDIYEIDPWPLIIARLSDADLDRLRDIVDGPWPPIHGPMPSPPADAPPTVDSLLDACTLAGFTEQLYVAHTGTDGWSRLSAYDAGAARAFVLAPL
jgi:hypothetical protein